MLLKTTFFRSVLGPSIAFNLLLVETNLHTHTHAHTHESPRSPGQVAPGLARSFFTASLHTGREISRDSVCALLVLYTPVSDLMVQGARAVVLPRRYRSLGGRFPALSFDHYEALTGPVDYYLRGNGYNTSFARAIERARFPSEASLQFPFVTP